MDRDATLAAALPVFYQYGYRKTTMDDLAQGVGLSRQGLYNHFGSKKALFEEMVRCLAAQAVEGFATTLSEGEEPLAERLLCAFDRYVGQHLDALRASPHAQEVSQMLCQQAGDLRRGVDNPILNTLATTMRVEGLAKGKREARDLALALHAASRGLSKMAADRAEYLKDLRAVIAVILPA